MPSRSPGVVELGDLVARFVSYPKFFKSGRVDTEMLFRFESSGSEESGVWRKLAPLEKDVHRRGCRQARFKNKGNLERYEQRGGASSGRPLPEPEYYCGFVQATRQVLEVANDFAHVEVFQKTENGDRAHVAIKIVFNENVHQKQKPAVRSEIIRELSTKVKDPHPHVCHGQKRDLQHPFHRGVQFVLAA